MATAGDKTADLPMRAVADAVGELPQAEAQAESIRPTRWLAAILLLLGAAGAIGVAAGARQATAVGHVLDCYAEPLTAQDGVLAIVHLHVDNRSRQRLALRGVRVQIETDAGRYEATASSLIDYQRYTETYAMLRMHAGEGVDPEMTIEPGASVDGSVLVNFPVTLEQFTARRAISAELLANENLLIRIR